jgi:hypothetical protein
MLDAKKRNDNMLMTFGHLAHYSSGSLKVRGILLISPGELK